MSYLPFQLPSEATLISTDDEEPPHLSTNQSKKKKGVLKSVAKKFRRKKKDKYYTGATNQVLEESYCDADTEDLLQTVGFIILFCQ